MKKTLVLLASLALSACAAKPLNPDAQGVMLSNEKPTNECKFFGEVVGGQGNWWTDDITSSKNIVKGSRNDLRNKAHAMGANFVHIQQVSGSETILGGTTMGLVGHAYRCDRL